MDLPNGKSTGVEKTAGLSGDPVSPAGSSSPVHSAPEVIGPSGDEEDGKRVAGETTTTVDEIEDGKGGWFAYLRTRNFWIVLLLGYALFLTPFSDQIPLHSFSPNGEGQTDHS